MNTLIYDIYLDKDMQLGGALLLLLTQITFSTKVRAIKIVK